jgi:hypothetical protein
MAAGHPTATSRPVGYPIDLMNKVRKGLNHAPYLMVYTPARRASCTDPRSIDLGGWSSNADSIR